MGENGIITKAKKGKGEYEESAVREKVEMALVDYNSDKITNGQEGEVKEALNKLLENDIFDDIEIEENIGIIDDYEITLGKEKQEVIIDGIDKVTGSLRLRCKLSTKEYTKGSVTIQVKASGNISKLIKPDNTEATLVNGKIELNYPISENGTYIFKIEDTEGNPVEKQVIVNNIDTLLPKDFNITVQQVDKKIVITANTEDAEATEASACSGIDRYEYFVKKSTDTNYPETPYKTNEVTISEYGTYHIFVKAYDKAGNSKNCNEEIIIEIINQNPLKYGQKVNYSANGVDDWKIFYINDDRNETFIITSSFLPSAKVPTNKTGMTTYGTYGAYWTTVPSYIEITDNVKKRFMITENWNINNDNVKCSSRLLDTNAWSDFVTEELKQKGSTAIGCPTLEMFIASWNEVYPNQKLAYTGVNEKGYICGGYDFTRMQGDSNRLYRPHISSPNGNQYWGNYLASPIIVGKAEALAYIHMGQNARGLNYGAYNDNKSSVRPIVCIPSNFLEFNSTTSSWDINIES